MVVDTTTIVDNKSRPLFGISKKLSQRRQSGLQAPARQVVEILDRDRPSIAHALQMDLGEGIVNALKMIDRLVKRSEKSEVRSR